MLCILPEGEDVGFFLEQCSLFMIGFTGFTGIGSACSLGLIQAASQPVKYHLTHRTCNYTLLVCVVLLLTCMCWCS